MNESAKCRIVREHLVTARRELRNARMIAVHAKVEAREAANRSKDADLDVKQLYEYVKTLSEWYAELRVAE